MGCLDLAFLKVFDAIFHVLSEIIKKSVEVGFDISSEIWALSTEVGVISGFETGTGVVDVLVSGSSFVALVIEYFVTNELLDLGEDIGVSLEDGRVHLEHVNLILDLSEVCLACCEVYLEVFTEPADE